MDFFRNIFLIKCALKTEQITFCYLLAFCEKWYDYQFINVCFLKKNVSFSEDAKIILIIMKNVFLYKKNRSHFSIYFQFFFVSDFFFHFNKKKKCSILFTNIHDWSQYLCHFARFTFDRMTFQLIFLFFFFIFPLIYSMIFLFCFIQFLFLISYF